MKIFYVPVISTYSTKNYVDSILQCKTYNGLQIKDILNDDEFAEMDIGLWGFKDGTHNLSEFDKISNGDVIFFRIKDDDGYAAFDGFGYIAKKLKSETLSNQVWNSHEYKNIIVIKKYIQFFTPFRLLENQNIVASLTHIPSRVWHHGYNMFRRWDMNYDEEKFIQQITGQNIILNSYCNPNISLGQLSGDIETSVINQTEKDQLTKIRIGQGTFKNKLLKTSHCCKICDLDDVRLLIASHIKPWKYSNNYERLDRNNGFLLCPDHDSLFDKGLICFDQNGKIIISKSLNIQTCNYMHINKDIKISINNSQLKYVAWHKENIFKEA